VKSTVIRAAAAAFLLLLVTIPFVAAHAELEESDPADGATITTPHTLTATFSEEFSSDPTKSFISVEDSSGTEVATGGQDPDDTLKMTVDLPELEPGTYTVRWQTTTVDDNGVERGTFTFDVAAAATNEPSTSATTAPATVAPTPAATPTTGGGQSTGIGTDVLMALAIGVVIIGLVAFLVFRRSRPEELPPAP